METTLDEKTIKALAREIARAQLTAADDFINESIELWPGEMKGTVPLIGTTTQAERLEEFRKHRGAAEFAMQREAKAKADHEKQAQERAAKRERDEAEFKVREELRFKSESAQWEIDAHEARKAGAPIPAKPLPLRTMNEAVLSERPASYRI
jgi:hypothetical protein